MGRALRAADEIRDVNTRYHDVAASSYDSKWGIDFGEVGQGQVVGKLRKLLGSTSLDRGFERSLEVGAGTGYFSLNLLAPGIVARGDVHRHLARDGARAGGERGAAGADRQDASGPTRSRCRSRTPASTSCSATPCSTTCPISSARSRSSTAC